MAGEPSLFGDELREPTRASLRETPVADWQVDLLRKALDARALTTMAERQQAIEVAAGRPVMALRELTHDEALRVLSRLGPASSASTPDGSAWDQRSEDTWIDRL